MSAELIDPGADLVAERGRDCMLSVCASGAGIIGVALGERSQCRQYLSELPKDDPVRLPQLEDVTRLSDVLRRRAPVHIATDFFAEDAVEIPDQRDQGMRRDGQAGFDVLNIKQLESTVIGNLYRSVGGNHAKFRFGPRERGFHVEPRLPPGFAREQGSNAGVGDSGGGRSMLHRRLPHVRQVGSDCKLAKEVTMVAPLEGIRVVEVANWLAAPSAAALMADLGADVVKIENPVGDPWRTTLMRGQKADFDPETDIDAPFELDNRGKRGFALSLERPGASEVMRRMIERADVFITNLTGPRIEKYDLPYERLKQINPRLIYVVLTGYGTRGVDQAKTGFDHSAFWSRSGIMSLFGDPGGPPMQCRPGQGDHTTALNLLSGTLAALRLRDLTGEGQRVEVTLQRTGAWTIGADVSAALITERQPKRMDRIVPGNPLFNWYETADGRWAMLVMPTPDRHWAPICRALEREDLLADDRYATLVDRRRHSAELTAQIADTMRTRTLAEWTPRLDAETLIWAPVAELPEVIADPQMEEMDAWSWLESAQGPFRTLNTPFEIAGADIGPRGPAPKTGQHTHEVLQELGLTDDELADLAASGALG